MIGVMPAVFYYSPEAPEDCSECYSERKKKLHNSSSSTENTRTTRKIRPANLNVTEWLSTMKNLTTYSLLFSR